MAFSLGTQAKAAGYRLSTFESIGSTNSAALADAGDDGRHWFVTDRQLSGRGRRGRVWQTEKGNLAASLRLKFEREDPRVATLGFVAGIALVSAIASLRLEDRSPAATNGGGADFLRGRIGLKWPNDVMADGAKLAGILLEAQKLTDGSQVVAVGMGINIVSAPGDLPYPATSVHELGAIGDAEDVFAALSNSWVSVFDLWQSAGGPAAVLKEWREWATGLGTEVSVSTASGVVHGVFSALDDEGRLLVRQPDGMIVAIAAGDVHFGAAANMHPQHS